MSHREISEDETHFLGEFEACRIPKDDWTHEAHVRMAWLQLRRFPFSEALEQIRGGIQRYNASLGGTGYHETVTVAFARIIHYRRQLASPVQSWSQFIEANADLLGKTPPLLDSHYSSELLASPEARNGFVDPDRDPLPEIS